MEEIKKKAREMFDERFKELNGETEIWKGNKPPNHTDIKSFIDQIIDFAVSKEREEKEMLADALLDMYEQYCDDGHMFMSAGEHASDVLERLGYAKFDEAGAIINTK